MPVGVPSRRVLSRRCGPSGPDVVHRCAVRRSARAGWRPHDGLGIPTVAIYQTDAAGFASLPRPVFRPHGPPGADAPAALAGADRTLAPSSWGDRCCGSAGSCGAPVGLVASTFAGSRRPGAARRGVPSWHPHGSGWSVSVGRLRPEKQVERLAVLGTLRGRGSSSSGTARCGGSCGAAALGGVPSGAPRR
ncbi:glycosyltransferase family 1 protein [Pseudonocardia sp. MCCB 268]|nr:glycosyltransferase family 1 protein [Pseudonocardia cytotoxica]